MVRKYKSSKYKGYTITFHDQGYGLILAKSEKLTRQFLGSGRYKSVALARAKKNIDTIIEARYKKEKRRKK